MSKQDRQGVRKASDIEQKYNLSLLKNVGKGASNREELSKIEQEISQYVAETNGKLENLEKKIEGIEPYSLPTANENILGGVKIGENVVIDENGVISVPVIHGKQGPKGDKGDKGEDGTGVTILGSYPTVEQLKAEHPTGEVGDSYLVDGYLYVWSVTDTDWVNVGNIKGPKGDQGIQGEQGPQGPKGPKGDKGDTVEIDSASEVKYSNTTSSLLATNVQDAIDEVATESANTYDDLSEHILNKNNPHNVSKADVGLGKVDNTSDAEKSVKHAVTSDSSTKATQDASGNVITSTYAKKTVASASANGLMSAEHFSKLNALPTNASLGSTYFKKADIVVYSGTKTTNSNGNIATNLPASSNIIIAASFDRDSGTTANCTIYTNGGNMGIHVADNSGTLSANVSGTLRYAYIKL